MFIYGILVENKYLSKFKKLKYCTYVLSELSRISHLIWLVDWHYVIFDNIETCWVLMDGSYFCDTNTRVQ